MLRREVSSLDRKGCGSQSLLFFLFLVFMPAGCERAAQSPQPQKTPRPVQVRILQQGAPPENSLVTAAVASWKTEQIGMEVTGRIEWVAEPNSSIEGRIQDRDGHLILPGTPIARIETERYRLQVQSAKAQVARSEQAIAAANIELEKSIPAQIKAAEAERKRAAIELNRSQQLLKKNAGAQTDVDRDEALLSTAESQIEQLQAAVTGKQAELLSLDAQLLQAQDSLRDAQRSLEDCTLYSSFRGQIADVAVVPGSVVSAGQPVATIQMMDPIKVDVEVSAEDSRRLRNRQRLPVLVTLEDGAIETHDGFLYLVDSVADPQTRTFTLTLLLLNRKVAVDEETASLPTIDQTWRVDFQFLPQAEAGMWYASEDAILSDKDGPYVWRIDNMAVGSPLPADRQLKVSKLRITLGESKIPFLGNWVFQQINVLDEAFDAKTTAIAGRLAVPEGEPETWNGDKVLFQNDSQWMLRPGDLVKVDLSETKVQTGLYVPMDAIAYEAQKTFLFLLSENDPPTVERVEVLTSGAASRVPSALMPVRAANSSATLVGRRYVSRGAHYLRDGEQVRVVADSVKTAEAAE